MQERNNVTMRDTEKVLGNIIKY